MFQRILQETVNTSRKQCVPVLTATEVFDHCCLVSLNSEDVTLFQWILQETVNTSRKQCVPVLTATEAGAITEMFFDLVPSLLLPALQRRCTKPPSA